MAVAEVFDLGVDGSSVDELDAAFDLIVSALWSCPVDDALARSDRYQNKLLAFDASLLASHVSDGASDRRVEKLAGRGGKRSRNEARKRARRAKVVSENPTLAQDLADGEEDLGPEKLDALADASEKSEGAAAQDEDLIEKVKAGSVDDARKITSDWVDDHTTPDEHEERRARQRRGRKVTRFVTRRGLDAILAEGDTESIAEIWSVLTSRRSRCTRTTEAETSRPESTPAPATSGCSTPSTSRSSPKPARPPLPTHPAGPSERRPSSTSR